jgi:hypothetical protein
MKNISARQIIKSASKINIDDNKIFYDGNLNLLLDYIEREFMIMKVSISDIHDPDSFIQPYEFMEVKMDPTNPSLLSIYNHHSLIMYQQILFLQELQDESPNEQRGEYLNELIAFYNDWNEYSSEFCNYLNQVILPKYEGRLLTELTINEINKDIIDLIDFKMSKKLI